MKPNGLPTQTVHNCGDCRFSSMQGKYGEDPFCSAGKFWIDRDRTTRYPEKCPLPKEGTTMVGIRRYDPYVVEKEDAYIDDAGAIVPFSKLWDDEEDKEGMPVREEVCHADGPEEAARIVRTYMDLQEKRRADPRGGYKSLVAYMYRRADELR